MGNSQWGSKKNAFLPASIKCMMIEQIDLFFIVRVHDHHDKKKRKTSHDTCPKSDGTKMAPCSNFFIIEAMNRNLMLNCGHYDIHVN